MSYADDMSKEQLLSASAIDRYVMEEEASNPEEHEKEKDSGKEKEEEEGEREGLENETGDAKSLELEVEKNAEEMKIVPSVQEREFESKKEMEKSVSEMNQFSCSGAGFEKPASMEKPKMELWNVEKENVDESAKMEEEKEGEGENGEHLMNGNQNMNERIVAHNEIENVQEMKDTQIVDNGIEMDGHMNVEDSSILQHEIEHMNDTNQIEKEASNDDENENEGVFRFSEVVGGDDLDVLDHNGEYTDQQLEEVYHFRHLESENEEDNENENEIENKEENKSVDEDREIKNENENDFSIQYDENSFTITPGINNPTYDKYPDLSCTFSFSENVIFTSDEVLLSDGYAENPDLIGILCENASELEIHISARTDKNGRVQRQPMEFKNERDAFESQINKLVRNIAIKGIRDAEILNETIYVYTHDALIHYLMPHGLEQQSGAAWGTRDICQGPFEFLLSFAHYDALRNILLNIFAHQSIETGQWYQWFMFDRYEDHFTSCHGDIVFWPLKCLASYILHSKDLSILNEMIPYIDTAEKESLETHLTRALDEISKRFIPGTRLITYAGGDWDDTLQPVDETLKKDMTSSWTQALAYETLSLLSQVLKNKPYIKPWKKILQEMRNDYDTFCIKDGVVAGMCILKNNKVTHLLHPCDTITGIHYRLISITRSIIAGLRTKEEAEKDIQLIEQHLQFPDGVHLMDRPVPYSGGECHLFRRGECAASVGREISLEYVHANIRYIQALCKAGYAEKAARELLLINPILICDRVSNALPRQSNVYFSSSDGQFADRYEYQEHFNMLKEGNVDVDGGWRLYSSGPGIYITQMITSILGIEIYNDAISISPCLSSTMYPLDVSISLDDSIFHLKYEQSENEKGVFQNEKAIDCSQKLTASGKRYYIIKWKNIAKNGKIIIKC